MTELKEIIAKNIAELRKNKQMTQLELAEKLNYSDKAISKWERGESIPDIIVLKQIADLFEVSVDYLLKEEHKKTNKIIGIIKRKNRILISLLAITPVWIIATILFFSFWITGEYLVYYWLLFVYAIPVSCVVAIVFNSMWGKNKFNFLIVSVLVWSILLSLYLGLKQYNLWMIFILGIPAEIVIILWSKIRKE